MKRDPDPPSGQSDLNEPQPGLFRRMWRSVFRMPLTPHSDHDRRRLVLDHLILHLRPVRVPEATLRYTHTWGLGGMSLVLLVILMVTGALMMFVYEPSPERAYASVLRLQQEVRFGGLVRNVHHWSANLLVVVVFLHLLRTFFTGAYHGVRQFTWVLGVLLLLLVIASNFTGYLLPWDQLSYWAVTILTGMLSYIPAFGEWLQHLVRGGSEVGSSTLVTFYAFHTTVLPVLIIALMALHFWRIRKARGVVVPHPYDEAPEPHPKQVLFIPNLLLREVTVALMLTACVLLFSVAFDAALGASANPGMSPNPAKAPWYFMGLQELLLHFHPTFAVLVIPAVALLGLLMLPYIRYDEEQAGPWFLSARGRRLAALSALVALVVTPSWILIDELLLDLPSVLPGLPALVRDGLLPFVVLSALLVGYTIAIKRRSQATRNELVQAVFSLLVVALLVLTAVGVWFRGPGMALVWPF